jgi:hypothetical protein
MRWLPSGCRAIPPGQKHDVRLLIFSKSPDGVCSNWTCRVFVPLGVAHVMRRDEFDDQFVV